MSSRPPADLAACAHDFRLCAAVIADAATVMRAGMRQVWTIEDLLEHFHGFSREQLLDLLKVHCAYQGVPGKPIRIHLDHVLHLQRVVRKQLVGA